jgi:hypothetical protein
MFISESIFSNISEIVQSATSQEDILHKFHTHYEQPIFNSLRERYLDTLKNWYKTYELPDYYAFKNSIVIYETRKHPNLEFLIYNLTYFARNWGLIIYCSAENYYFIQDILKHNKYKAQLNIVREDEGGKEVRDEYNKFLKSKDFWNSLLCKNVLLCEMDAYLRSPLPENVANFDYVCCKWPWHPNLAGGGGISIRNVNSMKNICEKFPTLTDELFAQDNWVAEGANRLNLSYNNTYLVESTHNIINPLGFHNWWTFINYNNLQNFYYIYDNYLTLEIKI